MGKYEPLAAFLNARRESHWPARFDEIEAILGFPLPQSARRHNAWWANDATGHSHARSWLEAGWRTEQIDLEGRKLVFRRLPKPPVERAPSHRPERTPSAGVAGATDDLVIRGLPVDVLRNLEIRAAQAGLPTHVFARDLLIRHSALGPAERSAHVAAIAAAQGVEVDVVDMIREARDSR